MKKLVTLVVVCALSSPLGAQWLKEPTKGIPRTADGKPDLSAPAPRTVEGKPDLSGLWRIDAGAYAGNLLADLKPGDIAASADALYKQRMEDLGKDDPSTFNCLPQGHRVIFGTAGMARIIQTPSVIAILYENLSHRQIFLDGRALPVDPHPSFMGYSVGRWEDDVLVVETVGFKDTTWLDFGGHPHTEALRMVERYRRTSIGHIELTATFEDPTVFSKMVTIDVKMDFAADTDMLEYVCNENEKSRQHFVQPSTSSTDIRVDPATLAKYAGVYRVMTPRGPANATVSVEGDQLMIDVPGRGSGQMVPQSTTMFLFRGATIEFVPDEKGEVTHLVVHVVEGDFKGPRVDTPPKP